MKFLERFVDLADKEITGVVRKLMTKKTTLLGLKLITGDLMESFNFQFHLIFIGSHETNDEYVIEARGGDKTFVFGVSVSSGFGKSYISTVMVSVLDGRKILACMVGSSDGQICFTTVKMTNVLYRTVEKGYDWKSSGFEKIGDKNLVPYIRISDLSYFGESRNGLLNKQKELFRKNLGEKFLTRLDYGPTWYGFMFSILNGFSADVIIVVVDKISDAVGVLFGLQSGWFIRSFRVREGELMTADPVKFFKNQILILSPSIEVVNKISEILFSSVVKKV